MGDHFSQFTQFQGTDRKCSEQKTEYWKGLSTLEKIVQNAIEELRNFVGPWRFLFSGGMQLISKSKQDQIISKVDTFCDERRYTTYF